MTRVSLRQLLLDALQTKHLLTAPQLLEYVEKGGDHFNKTSVYRALEKLLSDGTLCRQTFGGNEIVYELREHHHDHLVCTECGKVQVAECHLEDLEKVIEFKNFTPDHHHLTVYGQCRVCHSRTSQ